VGAGGHVALVLSLCDGQERLVVVPLPATVLLPSSANICLLPDVSVWLLSVLLYRRQEAG
jgi:hypothetical protein